MGLFDRFSAKKDVPEKSVAAAPASASPPAPESSQAEPAAAPRPSVVPLGTATVLERLKTAREKLELKDLAGATALYEEVLASAGDRPDVLVSISGDLGATGHPRTIIELVAPRYVAERHGPAIGFNLLQAYLAVHEPVPAQHVLDILFGLKRPDLEERLYGFSNAIADLMLTESIGGGPSPSMGGSAPAEVRKIDVVSISKPIWFYGLESLAERVLPPKAGRLRRVAFSQLALPGAYRDLEAAMIQPEDELGRLSRVIPLWLAEAFFFSPAYGSISAIAWTNQADGSRHPAIFGEEWRTETLRQLVESTNEDLDYVVTGALRQRSGDYEAILRVWEVKKFRERKHFLVRWNPATADAELGKLRQDLGQYMEWQPYPAEAGGTTYAPVPEVRAWLDGIGGSLALFLAEKKIWPPELLPPLEPLAATLARLAPQSEMASLAWLTFQQRARALGLAISAQPDHLFASPTVQAAAQL